MNRTDHVLIQSSLDSLAAIRGARASAHDPHPHLNHLLSPVKRIRSKWRRLSNTERQNAGESLASLSVLRQAGPITQVLRLMAQCRG
jgi:hypothetical protein